MTPDTARLKREADAWDETRERQMKGLGLTMSEISFELRRNPYRRAYHDALYAEGDA
jgi:hypothetical protein